MADAPFKRGDIVVYCHPPKPEWHGTLAIVGELLSSPSDPEYTIVIERFLLCAPTFPYTGHARNHVPWTPKAWQKIGELPDGTDI
jgi:hypothetical protein